MTATTTSAARPVVGVVRPPSPPARTAARGPRAGRRAFVLWLLCELEDHLARVRSYGQEGGGMARDEVSDAWAGWPPNREEARA